MTWMWITNPEELERVKPLEAEGARVRAEIAEIVSLGSDTACRLCGVETALTEEHAPSRKAGNRGRLIRGMIDHAASAAGGSVVWRGQMIQGGAKYDSLCAACNNTTGSWYNVAYVRLVRAAVAVLNPQRVAKQALVSMVATSQPGLTTRYPHIRTLLCEREARGSIAPLRLWFYLRATSGGVATGLATGLDIDRGRGNLLAGFSFWPLGWIMTIGDVAEVKGTVEVSTWTELAYMDRGPIEVKIPCQWAISPYPGDFRSPDEVGPDAWKILPLT